MTFTEWLEKHWRRPHESVSAALYRLAGAWELSYKTLYWAHRGARVNAETATEIEKLTKRRVSASALMLLPPRGRLIAEAAA